MSAAIGGFCFGIVFGYILGVITIGVIAMDDRKPNGRADG